MIKLLSAALLFFGSVTFGACLAKKPEKALRYAEKLHLDAAELADSVKTLGLPLREAIAALSASEGFFGDLKKAAAGGKDLAFAARSAAERAEKEGLMPPDLKRAVCDLFLRLGEGSAENQEKQFSDFSARASDIIKDLSESAAKTKKLCLALGAAAGLTAVIMTV